MITEIFSLLSSLDITKNNKLDKKFDFNLSRNRIRSISAYSSNSIFYFPTIVIDQATPDEIAMVSRMLEKSYASFVITCISLMPFHRIHADDQGSIEEYLSQFHQNLGISGGTQVGGLVVAAGGIASVGYVGAAFAVAAFALCSVLMIRPMKRADVLRAGDR